MEDKACPCTSGTTYAECCQPYLEGKAAAPTAEALMRSRYTAFAMGMVDYIHDTLAPESRSDFDRKGTEQWAKRSEWKKLEIHETEQGQPGDEEGIVDFTAHYIMDGKKVAHPERSLFRFDRDDQRWYFVEPITASQKPVVKVPTPGRNEPCPCGSGKKYKKCCG